jgi:hypothetical protein
MMLWKLFCFSETPRIVLLSYAHQHRCTAVCRAILKSMNKFQQLHICDVYITVFQFCSCTLDTWIRSLDFVLHLVSCCGLTRCWGRVLYLMRKDMIPPKFWNYTDSLVDSEMSGNWNVGIGVTWLIAMGAGWMCAKSIMDLRDWTQ